MEKVEFENPPFYLPLQASLSKMLHSKMAGRSGGLNVKVIFLLVIEDKRKGGSKKEGLAAERINDPNAYSDSSFTF